MPYSWFEFVDDYTKNYAGLNFASRNLLDSAAGGTFMEITLGEATKLLDNIMVNYSQWLPKDLLIKSACDRRNQCFEWKDGWTYEFIC